MKPFQITERGGEGHYLSHEGADRATTNTQLAAALAAMGIPFDTKPCSVVQGDGIASGGRITWYFGPRSECGQYSTAELMAAWDDRDWHRKHPEHPFSYIKCAFQNFQRLLDKVKNDVPLGCVRQRGKIALISLNAPQHLQDLIFKKL